MMSITGLRIAANLREIALHIQAVSRRCEIDKPRHEPLHQRMKRRNQLLALFCLIAFAGLGVLYFQHWVVQKPFGIVLFVGEGLAPGSVAAARVFAGAADTPLALDSLPYTALVTNYSKDFATPDSAAAATAIATGVKVNNRAVSSDADGKRLTNILELAHAAGRATGLVTNGRLSDATAAAFFAHESEVNDHDSIARELAEHGKIDVVLGGGSADFVGQDKGGYRSDARDLLLELRRNGCELVRTKGELEAVPAWRRPKLFGAFATAELAYSDQLETRGIQPALPDMVRRAIELLQYNRTGYVLVVDAALMRKAAQENNGERTLAEIAEFDRAVAVAQRYVGEHSMILVCGDVAVGGLSMNGAPFRKDRGIAVLGLNSAGDPWLTWSTGPNGTASYGASRLLEAAPKQTPSEEEPAAHPPQEPAAFYAKSALNTVDDVVAFGSGAGTESLHGTIDNTAIFRIIRRNL
jgi:alkaline phosphatase